MPLVEGLVCISPNLDLFWSKLSYSERMKLKGYKGFSSSTWFWIEEDDYIKRYRNELGLVPLQQIGCVERYCVRVKEQYPYSYVIFLSNNLGRKQEKNSKLEFIGYDVGVPSEYDDPVFFSGIANEINSLKENKLNQFVEKLNKHYLFDSESDCASYLAERSCLLESGNSGHIETAFQTCLLQIFEIYILKE